MSGKLIHRLAIGLLVVTSIFFGFVLAAVFNLVLPKGVSEAIQLPFVQRGPVEFTEGLPEGVRYPLEGLSLNESSGDLPIQDFMQIAEAGKAMVVNISSISTRGETAGSGAEGGPKFGSGILLDPDGYILTNWHVVEDSDKVLITLLNGNRYSAQVVGADPLTDLALLKIFSRHKLPSAVLGDSDTVKSGEWVMAIGHPSGLNHTITVGVVSAVGRDFDVNAAYRNFIQTDAAINPGNSGGPLLNRRGEVIGINTAIFQGTQNLGFAIPINMAKLVIEQLRQTGRVKRGYLGLQPESISEDLREALGLPDRKGALVTNVVKTMEDGQPGPAFVAGIRIGDIITSFDGSRIDNIDQLYILAAYSPPGKTVSLEVFRDGRKIPLSVTLSSRQEESPVRLPSTRRVSGRYPLGLNVAPLDLGAKGALRRITDDYFTTGVLVLDVEVGSNSYDKGIMPGDIITTVGGRTVSGEEDFSEAVDSAFARGEFAVLYVIPRIDSSQRRFVAVHK